MQIIGGTYRGRKLTPPKGSETRPSSSKLRESFFNIVQNYIEEAHFLDLFAGSGAMGLEALSRGARFACFIDSSSFAKQAILQNIKSLNVHEHSRILQGDVFRLLAKLEQPFDIIFADAPYAQGAETSLKLLKFLDESSLLREGGMLFIEDVEKSLSIELKTLKLISERRFGHSYLHQFQKTN